MAQCPLCDSESTNTEIPQCFDEVKVNCSVCEVYRINILDLQSALEGDNEEAKRIYLRNILHKKYTPNLSNLRQGDPFPIFDDISGILSNFSLPSPAEAFDNFILYIGEQSKNKFGVIQNICKQKSISATGITSIEGVFEFNREAEKRGYFQEQKQPLGPTSTLCLKLTLEGWQRYEELKRVQKDSRRAFMAMKFSGEPFDSIFTQHFKPAIDEQTGYTIESLADNPEAGLIDNRIRMEIRRAKFVIADLTHHNNGAYFEAGFAEGLGIPVIYTCEKTIFKDQKTHFDTAHFTTVQWSQETIEQDVKELVATIQNTLASFA